MPHLEIVTDIMPDESEDDLDILREYFISLGEYCPKGVWDAFNRLEKHVIESPTHLIAEAKEIIRTNVTLEILSEQ